MPAARISWYFGNDSLANDNRRVKISVVPSSELGSHISHLDLINPVAPVGLMATLHILLQKIGQLGNGF